MTNTQQRKIIWIFCIVFAATLTGCVSEPTRSYNKEIVHHYAALSLLYEKEKMMGKRSDSAYQILVHHFFEKRNIRQADFQQQVNEISDNVTMWKYFILDVSGAIDSMKLKGM